MKLLKFKEFIKEHAIYTNHMFERDFLRLCSDETYPKIPDYIKTDVARLVSYQYPDMDITIKIRLYKRYVNTPKDKNVKPSSGDCLYIYIKNNTVITLVFGSMAQKANNIIEADSIFELVKYTESVNLAKYKKFNQKNIDQYLKNIKSMNIELNGKYYKYSNGFLISDNELIDIYKLSDEDFEHIRLQLANIGVYESVMF